MRMPKMRASWTEPPMRHILARRGPQPRRAAGRANVRSALADDRAVDDEARGAERAAVGRRQRAGAAEVRDLRELGLPGRGHTGRPGGEVDVPERAVAALVRRPREDVQRVEPVDDRGVEALALWVVRAGRAVDERRERGPGRVGPVAAGERGGVQGRRQGRVLERGGARARAAASGSVASVETYLTGLPRAKPFVSR